MKKIFMILILFLLFNSICFAQTKEVRLRVDGLACPFCAYGLEKKLKLLEGLESLNISLKKGLVEMTFKEDNNLDISKLKTIVKDAGYTLKGVEISSFGYVKKEAENFLFHIKGNPGKFYIFDIGHMQKEYQKDLSVINLNEELKEKLARFFEDRTLIKIIGAIHLHADGSYGLAIKLYSIVAGEK
ncbi:MAG: Heavy-metal-associated domain protein [Candidatus Scalindua rubra]|uniref:Heavy-metal-associated domain protein n=1 Tax=Candidatus Scalindua rubra TaxID=1872076 RepID=A0A1E3X7Y1_9BACT|nr:MAG: Heavy-metal-associated domain protein [Candidatus Scalindua rubra]